ncbi:hypothetical protein [Rhizobium laguerreae]|uniref:hypothetical protein n=1 Tax=Rhizobium laguerreae TaxID=1076926 RepID=UPI001C91F497|nr:hypothetical protein [Rhizobium laguerreae]MBY3483364.1 hypothetical protein [Rhizobium laguerreae]
MDYEHSSPRHSSHSALRIWGFINDRIPEGFKTPTFINGQFHLQVVDQRDNVIGFEPYDDKIDRPVVRPNEPLEEYYSVVGRAPIHVFKPALGDLIVGRKHTIAPKMRQWLRREDAVSASVAFDVLLFVGASDERLREAADNLANSLRFKKDENREKYKARLSDVIEQRFSSGEAAGRTLDASTLSKKIDIASLEEGLSLAIQTAEPDLSARLERVENSYIRWNELNEDGPSSLTSKQVRELLPILLEIENDNVGLRPARDLLRYIYFINLLNRFCRINKKKAASDPDTIPPSEMMSLLLCPSSDFVEACIRLLSFITPEVRRDGWVPARSIVVGELVKIGEREIEVANNGTIFRIEENLLSVQSFHNMMDVGDYVLFSVRNSNRGSSRGREFVSSIFNLFFPHDLERPVKIELGASNSWAVIMLDPSDKGKILRNNGIFVQQMCEALGLRRITITNQRGDSPEDKLREFRDFINSAWSDLKIAGFDDRSLALKLVVEDASKVDARKLRTFSSMLDKLYPRHTKTLTIADGTQDRPIDLDRLRERLEE